VAEAYVQMMRRSNARFRKDCLEDPPVRGNSVWNLGVSVDCPREFRNRVQ